MALKYTTFVVTLLCFVFITSCLTDSGSQSRTSQYAVDFQLQDVGSAQVSGGDTLRVLAVSFLQGRIALQSVSQDSLVLYSGTGVYSYQFPGSAVQRLLSGNLEQGTYNGMVYNINKAEVGAENIPGSFVDGEGEDQRYSMIISGTYNNSEFTYKSTQPFYYEFNITSPVEIPEENTSLALGVNFDVNGAFLEADSSGFLDPTVPENAEQINSNIESSIELLPFEGQ